MIVFVPRGPAVEAARPHIDARGPESSIRRYRVTVEARSDGLGRGSELVEHLPLA